MSIYVPVYIIYIYLYFFCLADDRAHVSTMHGSKADTDTDGCACIVWLYGGSEPSADASTFPV
jgi:hypothetical protein